MSDFSEKGKCSMAVGLSRCGVCMGRPMGACMHACGGLRVFHLHQFNYEKTRTCLVPWLPPLSLLQKSLSGKGCGRGPAGI